MKYDIETEYWNGRILVLRDYVCTNGGGRIGYTLLVKDCYKLPIPEGPV